MVRRFQQLTLIVLQHSSDTKNALSRSTEQREYELNAYRRAICILPLISEYRHAEPPKWSTDTTKATENHWISAILRLASAESSPIRTVPSASVFHRVNLPRSSEDDSCESGSRAQSGRIQILPSVRNWTLMNQVLTIPRRLLCRVANESGG